MLRDPSSTAVSPARQPNPADTTRRFCMLGFYSILVGCAAAGVHGQLRRAVWRRHRRGGHRTAYGWRRAAAGVARRSGQANKRIHMKDDLSNLYTHK